MGKRTVSRLHSTASLVGNGPSGPGHITRLSSLPPIKTISFPSASNRPVAIGASKKACRYHIALISEFKPLIPLLPTVTADSVAVRDLLVAEGPVLAGNA